MTLSIDLNPNYLATVERILAEHVPACEVRAFGSRATWTAKDYSDLDLAIVGKGPLDRRTLGRLKESFEESNLPMRVDVLDWHSISESIQREIGRDYVVVQEGEERRTAGEWREVMLGDVCNEADLVSGADSAEPWGQGRLPLRRHGSPDTLIRSQTTVSVDERTFHRAAVPAFQSRRAL